MLEHAVCAGSCLCLLLYLFLCLKLLLSRECVWGSTALWWGRVRRALYTWTLLSCRYRWSSSLCWRHIHGGQTSCRVSGVSIW